MAEKAQKAKKGKKKKKKDKSPPFEVRKSDIQGKGAFASRRIRAGQRVIEYTGERISPKEEAKRYNDGKMKRHHTFLFEIDDKTTIDAAVGGSDARFINHSCDPNCEAVNDDGRIFIEAIKNIQPGVELNYDYNYQHEGPISKKDRKFYFCRCGSPKCRGTILKQVKKRKSKKKKKGKKKKK